MASHDAGFPPFPRCLRIPSGFPHSRGLDDWIYLFVPTQLDYSHRKELITDVSGPQRNGSPVTPRNVVESLDIRDDRRLRCREDRSLA